VSPAPSAEQARVLAKVQAPDTNFPDYPFVPKAFVHASGLTQSYLDEGPAGAVDPEVVLMLHGNPSWSYYWRKLVLGLRDRYRCIVPDHIGMGLSDKPGDAHYDYTLSSRIDDLGRLLEGIGITGPVTLAVHDWGGMIGFGWALARSERVRRVVVLNTGAFPLPSAKPLPWQLRLGRETWLGAMMIRGLNAFAAGAARDGVARPLDPAVRAAYLAPYDSWANRIATLRFVQDIPLASGDRAWGLVEAAGEKLPDYADRPAFLGWGLRDFVFDEHFLDGFRTALPQAESHVFPDAGHYVLEDKADVLVPAIRTFLDANPL
jgi:pimeloyl-ACP methyl ester carboxylesterase